jgi:hypothetical protein
MLLELDARYAWLLAWPLRAVRWVTGSDTWHLHVMRLAYAALGVLWLFEAFAKTPTRAEEHGVLYAVIMLQFALIISIVAWLVLVAVCAMALTIHEAARKAVGDTVNVPPQAFSFFKIRAMWFTIELLALPGVVLNGDRWRALSAAFLVAYWLAAYAVTLDPPGKSLPQLIRSLAGKIMHGGVQLQPSGV